MEFTTRRTNTEVRFVDEEMFSKWEKNYFNGVEENDLDRKETLKEQNKEEEKQMGFWGYDEPQQDAVEEDLGDKSMSMW